MLATATLAGIIYAATPPSVVAMGQSIKGGDVSIAYAHLPEDGILAIHPSNSKGGMSEEVIGYVALKAGEKIWAALRQDTGSKGAYEFGMAGKTDADPLFTADGRPI